MNIGQPLSKYRFRLPAMACGADNPISPARQGGSTFNGPQGMGRLRKQRRNPHGSAWHWKQTDCWYFTLPGTKKRIALFDEQGERIRGRQNQDVAEHALARAKLAGEAQGVAAVAD